jgi:DNA-binding Lrp family transcriptional regulator
VDAVDRKILAEPADGRLTLTELTAHVSLSVSPCHRRLRELERTGIITGYKATLDPAALGLTFEALVFVTMSQEDRAILAAFEDGLAAIPNVISAERLFGDPRLHAASPHHRPRRVPFATGRTARHPARRASHDLDASHETHRRRPTTAGHREGIAGRQSQPPSPSMHA